MKVHPSTLALLGLEARERQARYKSQRPQRRESEGALVELHDGTVPFASVRALADTLGVPIDELLGTLGIAGRTAMRRKASGSLKADEADRLLRVARVLQEAIHVFGGREKAAAWLRATHPMLGDVPAYRLLDSDAGAKFVSDELVRIDFGDFA